MRVLVLGCGYIGSAVALDLVRSPSVSRVVAADVDRGRLIALRRRSSSKKLSTVALDASDIQSTSRLMASFDVAVGAVPGRLGFRAMKAAIRAHVNMVDVSYMKEDPLRLNESAKAAGVTLVPDMGFSPGLSNLLVGHAASQLGTVEKIGIWSGGLPQKPRPPLRYSVTWSPEDLLEEYTRKARIISRGAVVSLEPLSGLEYLRVPGIGQLECFYTDGLRTLLHTYRSAEEVFEKTIRYPGHAEKISVLSAIGLMSDQRIEVKGATVTPKAVLAALLRARAPENERDLVILKVRVSGRLNGERVTHSYLLIDYYDEKRGLSAMARATAYPLSVLTQMVGKGIISHEGVLPPEKIGTNEDVFHMTMNELGARGLALKATKRRLI